MIRKRTKFTIPATIILAILLVTIFAVVPAFAASPLGARNYSGSGGYKVSATKGASPRFTTHSANIYTLPKETASSKLVSNPHKLVLRTSPKLAQAKAAASHNKNAPVNRSELAVTASKTSASNRFKGMADSATICPYFGGCQPPDMALATSPKYVLQGVNTSYAIYNTVGKAVVGPIEDNTWYGVPPLPNKCDPAGPFLSDPRAFYDPNDGRFWAAMLQVEGAFGLNSCPFLTRYWIAVSQTSDPRGSWNVYAVDMSLGTTNAADYTQFGFDQQAIYISGNMFNQAGSAYEYAELFGANKSSMEQGLAVSFFGFSRLSVSSSTTVLVDTVQPVEAQARKVSGPRAGLFINSWNMNGDPFGDNCFSTVCHGLAIWTITNPGTSSDGLSFAFTNTAGYILPPNADEPGCTQCIESLDTRISATPPYHNGLISFALETGINNGSQVVPGILWGQVAPQLNDAGALSGALVYQDGYYFYGGDGAATFGALMPDANGDLFMLFEFMNSSSNPGVAYTARRVTLSLGVFHDGGIYLQSGIAPTFDSRWGDFEATSYDGLSKDNVWFSGQYSAANGDWATFIGRDNFCATCN